jgi:hypothetical protein
VSACDDEGSHSRWSAEITNVSRWRHPIRTWWLSAVDMGDSEVGAPTEERRIIGLDQVRNRARAYVYEGVVRGARVAIVLDDWPVQPFMQGGSHLTGFLAAERCIYDTAGQPNCSEQVTEREQCYPLFRPHPARQLGHGMSPGKPLGDQSVDCVYLHLWPPQELPTEPVRGMHARGGLVVGNDARGVMCTPSRDVQ